MRSFILGLIMVFLCTLPVFASGTTSYRYESDHSYVTITEMVASNQKNAFEMVEPESLAILFGDSPIFEHMVPTIDQIDGADNWFVLEGFVVDEDGNKIPANFTALSVDTY